MVASAPMSLRATVRDALVVTGRFLVVVLENGFDGNARRDEEVEIPLVIGGTKRLRVRGVEIMDGEIVDGRRESWVALTFGLDQLAPDQVARGGELRSAE